MSRDSWMAYARKCRRSNERCSCSRDTLSWEIHQWKSDWHAHPTRLRHSPTGIETDNTHLSDSAAISRSRDCACQSTWPGRDTQLYPRHETGKTFRKQTINIIDMMHIMSIMHSPKHLSTRFDKELGSARCHNINNHINEYNMNTHSYYEYS